MRKYSGKTNEGIKKREPDITSNSPRYYEKHYLQKHDFSSHRVFPSLDISPELPIYILFHVRS